MNIKNNKGVTLTILVITIIVMFVLFGITYSSATDLLKNTQRNKMRTMLYMVQSRAQILLNEYLFENDGELASVDDTKIQSFLKGSVCKNVSEFNSVGFPDTTIPGKDTMIYCSWNETTLKEQGIDTNNLTNGDTIIIQYDIKNETVEVASSKGFTSDGVTIHKLEEFKDN